ncbi:MAG: hypothetical protein KDI44_03630 [Thiothrix sp.]|nr:hypothetical protein [Thiothrix sp.]HPQ95429.1 hypothetical protein [Thiolinea sp.]
MSSKYKIVLPMFFVLLTSTASSRAETGDNDPQVHSVRHFPVIVRNETIAAGLCKIHFDNGKTLEVRCNNQPGRPGPGQTRATL